MPRTAPKCPCLPMFFSFKVDKVRAKDRLLDITAVLTCGVVNGCRIRVRPVIRPPCAEKRPDNHCDSGDQENHTETEGRSELKCQLSKEQLKALRSQQGWPHFKEVFMLSSVDREDVETLKVPPPPLLKALFLLRRYELSPSLVFFVLFCAVDLFHYQSQNRVMGVPQ